MSTSNRFQFGSSARKSIDGIAGKLQKHQPDSKSAMEFSEIMKRHSDKEQAASRDRIETASEEKARTLFGTTTESEYVAPSEFMKSGSHFQSSFDHQDNPSTVSKNSEISQSNHTAEYQSTDTLDTRQSINKIEKLVETLFPRSLKTETLNTHQKWTIDLKIADTRVAVISLEYLSTGDWQLRMVDNEEESGQSGLDHFSSEIDCEGIDERQFFSELQHQLEKKYPELRFTAGDSKDLV